MRRRCINLKLSVQNNSLRFAYSGPLINGRKTCKMREERKRFEGSGWRVFQSSFIIWRRKRLKGFIMV